MVNDSIIRMWKEYVKSTGGSAASIGYTAWQFGMTSEVADELAYLVLAGRKRATASLVCSREYEGEPLPLSGDLSIVLGGDGRAKCIIRTTAVNIMPFNTVSEEFARKEGEADGSLESWKDIHRRFFAAECQSIEKKFSEDMDVVCEEFELVFH